MTPFVNFPLNKIYGLLNKAEGIPKESTDCWGGGNTIGGSPRKSGSRLKPQELEKLINDFSQG